MVYAAREAVAELVNVSDPLRVAFGCNATKALNAALFGLLRPGQHVITGSVEHNSVQLGNAPAARARGTGGCAHRCPLLTGGDAWSKRRSALSGRTRR
ncbi:MAG: aminotransferase class V-fold PLP-dependent enzyme [Aggregatilineales bacterium]